MPRTSSLPERLRYLQSFRDEFASSPDGELNEDTGIASLFSIFQKRIEGYPSVEAEKILEEDLAALENWLAAPEQQNDCLHFASGVFLIASPAELVEQIWEESKKRKVPLPWVEMFSPKGAKIRRFEKEGDGGMLVRWKGLLIGLGVARKNIPAVSNEFAAQWKDGDKVARSSVRFGEVTGEKYVRISENRFGRPEKSVRYILTVPGGHIEAYIHFPGKRPSAKWDEAKITEYTQLDCSKWNELPVEAFFHTLRVISKQRSDD